MLLQSPISSPLQHLSFSSTYFCSQTHVGFYNPVLIRTNRNRNISITCTVDYERKSPSKWQRLSRRIFLMENPSLGCSTVLNQWVEEGKSLTKFDLYHCAKELRKRRKFKLAFEVYDWMDNQGGDGFRLSSSDRAIYLSLISKVYGISCAEEYFFKLPKSSKDNRTYGALLNAYVQAKMREKAESLFEEMRGRGYTTICLPFNAMMTLYRNLNEYEKIIALIMEMLEKNIQLDLYAYSLWITACGFLGSTEKMDQVVERIKLDRTINPNWTTYNTMASAYIKLGQIEKAKDCLKTFENKMKGNAQKPYQHLVTLYSSIGKKEDVFRIWSTYKSSFPYIGNRGYHAMISSLLKLDDIEGAEKFYGEWLSVRTSYDCEICNLLIRWYVKNGLLEKAEGFLDQVFEIGGKVNADTWEYLAEGHIEKKQIPDALSCMKEATTAQRSDSWRLNPRVVSDFFSICEQESDLESKELLLEVFRQVGWFEDERYMLMISTNGGTDSGSMDRDRNRIDGDNNDDDGTDMLINQLQESF